jgi:protein SCO1/2
MIKRKWIFSLFALIAVLWAAVFAGARWIQKGLNRDHTNAAGFAQQDVSDSSDLKIYWDAPDFSFPDQDGKTVTRQDLLGHVWVADFIFTQCTSACPILTSKLILVQKRVQLPAVRFISFSVDPEHDTPAALKAYAQLWEGDQARWRLLSTNPTGLAQLTAAMKVTAAASGDPDNPIIHSNLFFLIDTAGRVRGIYNSGESEAVSRLEEDVRTLAGETATPIDSNPATSADVQRGKALFGSMGCLACHTRKAIAPPLESVYGSMVRLDNRQLVWADEAYLHESIVDPSAKIVAGYTKSMPSYRNYLSDQQIMDLVAYIKSLSSNSPGGHGIASASSTTAPDTDELVVDPVCKMQVKADASAPHAVFNGKTYYFCSDNCREQFQKKPQTYAAATQPVQ